MLLGILSFPLWLLRIIVVPHPHHILVMPVFCFRNFIHSSESNSYLTGILIYFSIITIVVEYFFTCLMHIIMSSLLIFALCILFPILRTHSSLFVISTADFIKSLFQTDGLPFHYILFLLLQKLFFSY